METKTTLNGNAIKHFLKEKGFDVRVNTSGGIQPTYTIEILHAPQEMFGKRERFNNLLKQMETVDAPNEYYRAIQSDVNKFIIDNGGRANSFYFKFKK